MFEAADESGDGYVDLEEFREVVSNPQVMTWLASMELDAGDVDTLFNHIDVQRVGKISVDDLIAGVYRLRGYGRSIDLANLVRDQQQLFEMILELHDQTGPVSSMAVSRGGPLRL